MYLLRIFTKCKKLSSFMIWAVPYSCYLGMWADLNFPMSKFSMYHHFRHRDEPIKPNRTIGHLHEIFSVTIRFYTKFPTIWCIMCISVAIFYAMYEIILFHNMGCTVFGPVGGLKFAKWANFQCIIILGTETNLLNQIWWKSDN